MIKTQKKDTIERYIALGVMKLTKEQLEASKKAAEDFARVSADPECAQAKRDEQQGKKLKRMLNAYFNRG